MPLKFLPSRKKKTPDNSATTEPAAVTPVVDSGVPVTSAPLDSVSPSGETATKPTKATTGGARALLNRAAVVFLFVGAITLAAGSTWVAMQVIAERDQLRGDYTEAKKALNETVLAAATNSKLKGKSNTAARVEIFTPAIRGYQAIISANNQNPERLDEVAAAAFHAAPLQAKIGASACVPTMQLGIDAMRRMGEAGYDIERFPSLYEAAMRTTAPMEWAVMNDAELQVQAIALIFVFGEAEGTLTKLSERYPQATTFRSDLAALLRISASLQSAVPDRAPFAIRAWVQARDLLETLVRDAPGNVDFQNRLAEALTGAANLQRQDGQTDEAIANFKRAVEVRQQLVEGNPEDKALADELAKAKSTLSKLQPAG